MRTLRGALFVALLALAGAAWPDQNMLAQQNTPPAAGKIDFSKAAAAARAQPGAGEAGASGKLLAQDLEAQARHVQWQRDYERRGWEWHLLSTQLLFGVVIAIVLFGLFITYMQFRRDYSDWEKRPAQANSEKAAAEGAAEAQRPLAGATTLKLSPAGLEVTSQIVGLIVLALSLAFFFLYVKEVYPIREVQVTGAAQSAGSAPKGEGAGTADK